MRAPRLLLSVPFLAAVFLLPAKARAHCDTLDGPVVSAARTALDTGRIEPVLAWVQPAAEPEIRDAFARARAVRNASAQARGLADRWFFETLVRVHRAGEGAPFTGLKPAGTVDPAVAAADRAIAGADPKQLEELLVRSVRDGLHRTYAPLAKEKAPGTDVAAGRRWVAAYVAFVHWAEGVQAAAAGPGEHGAGHASHGAGEHALDVAEREAGEAGSHAPAATEGHAH